MRTHGQELEQLGDLRPRADRVDDERTSLMYQAAATGHPEVLGGSGMLGLQRLIGNAAVSRAAVSRDAEAEEERSPVLDVVNSGGGQALDSDTRSDMENRLGADFSDVRVHNDATAHNSAKAVNAHAYTVGSHVVFQRDKFDPQSSDGKLMLAHELTHVVQQRSGPVDGTPAGGGIQVSDPGDRFEREASANAERAMAGPAPVQTSAAPGAVGVQRDEDEGGEEEAVQTYVQREEEAGEEEEAPA
jgi:hypothetical protein